MDHTITRRWLMTFKTPNGGWLRCQFDAIGVTWPPRKGWLKEESLGRRISESQRMAFEAPVSLDAAQREWELDRQMRNAMARDMSELD